jgi:nucleoside-diphosphate-sugar epimerase
MANETILVTGATGQVGKRLVPRLLSWREAGDEIRVLVRTREAAEHFEALGARAVVGDITDAADRKRALDGVALVVNSAATFRSPQVTEADMYAVNRDAAVALARESVQAGVRRFVQVSTNLVYGPGVGRPLREDDELRAEAAGQGGGGRASVYPHSKRQSEEQLKQLAAETGFDVVTVRLAFVYGDGDPHIENALSRFNLTDQPAHSLMAMVHHADVAQGVHRALRTVRPDGAGYTAYNLAGDAASTIYELFELGGRELDVTAGPGGTVEDPWFGIPDLTRTYRELGFRPIYPTAKAAWRDGAL